MDRPPSHVFQNSSHKDNSPSRVVLNLNSSNPGHTQNIVVTGIDEWRNNTERREVVSRAMNTAAGRDINLANAFRLRQFVGGKKRPILVQLTSV